MSLVSIEDDDHFYISYLIENPMSYVLNVKKGNGKLEPALHRGWCRSICTRKKTDRLSPFTGQGYKKIASLSYKEVIAWFNTFNKSDEEISVCSKCSPNENIVPKSLPDTDLLDTHLEAEYLEGKNLSDEEILEKIRELSVESKKKPISSFRYERNRYIVQAVLRRAKGICDSCKEPAPFMRKTDGSPFLEVHHVQPLSKKGYDLITNCLAVCPNCHRKAHHG